MKPSTGCGMPSISPILLRLKSLFPRWKKHFYFEDDLLQVVASLAEREGRTLDEIAADLIATALAHRTFVEETYLRWIALTPREQQIAALICLNYSNRQVSDLLGITQDTVRSHQRKIFSKFHLHTKVGLRRVLSPSNGWDFIAWEAEHFDPPSAWRVLTKLIGKYSSTPFH
jgi:DNA-binding CsgD family transcriptional regulator